GFDRKTPAELVLNVQIRLIRDRRHLPGIEIGDRRVRLLADRNRAVRAAEGRAAVGGHTVLEVEGALGRRLRRDPERGCGEAEGRRITDRVADGGAVENAGAATQYGPARVADLLRKSEARPDVVSFRRE